MFEFGRMLCLVVTGLFLEAVVCERNDAIVEGEATQAAKKCPAKCLCSDDRLMLTCRSVRLHELEEIAAKFSEVESLFVKDSALGHIGNETFKQLATVQILDLSRSEVKSLEAGTLDHIKDLRELTLSHNHIEIVGHTVSFFDRMFAGRVVHVPSFLRTKNLHKVDLSWNDIRHVAKESLYGMKFVQNLNLSSNNMHNVDYAFRYLMGVKVLDLSYNRIIKVDPNFGRMQLIMEELYLSHNYITVMPQFPSFQCDSLKRVDLSYNEISSVSRAGVSDCANIEYLDLEHNLLKTISATDFAKNANLKSLNIGQNSIDMIEDGAFESCENMEELYISGNRIRDITWGTLKGLNKMSIFSAASNQLRYINESTLSDCVWLSYVYLQHNQIVYIHPNAFSRLSLLLILNLSANRLSVPYSEWFRTLSGGFYFDASSQQVLQEERGSLATFNLTGNDWSCDCESERFYEWTQHQTLLSPELLPEIICATPRFHKGKKMLELEKDEFVCDLLHHAKSYFLFYSSAFVSVFIFILLCGVYCILQCNRKQNIHAL